MGKRLARTNASEGKTQLARFLLDGLFEVVQYILLDNDFYKDGLTESNTSGVDHLPGAGIFANFGRRFEADRYFNFLALGNKRP